MTVENKGTSAATTSVATIMTRDVKCVTADVQVDTLAKMLVNEGFSGAPVIDGSGKPIGIVTKTDIVRDRVQRGEQKATVEEIMMPIAFTLPEDASIAEAAGLMALDGTHHVPIVSKANVVVGIVSSLDVLRFVAREAGLSAGLKR